MTQLLASHTIGPKPYAGSSCCMVMTFIASTAATSTAAEGITVSISPASTLDLADVDIPLDERNLAYRAAGLISFEGMQLRTDVGEPVRV